MISRIARWAVPLVALASSLAVLPSSAAAVTWHNTGNTAFTATGSTIATFAGTARTLVCNTASATGTASGGSVVASTYNIPGTLTYSPCSLAGQLTYSHCGFTLTGTTQAVSGVTSGNADLTCVVRLTASNTALCNIQGSLPFTYFNPSLPVVGGSITFTASSTLVASHSSGTSCLMGTGSVFAYHHTLKVTNGTGGSGTSGPILTRTP